MPASAYNSLVLTSLTSYCNSGINSLTFQRGPNPVFAFSLPACLTKTNPMILKYNAKHGSLSSMTNTYRALSECRPFHWGPLHSLSYWVLTSALGRRYKDYPSLTAEAERFLQQDTTSKLYEEELFGLANWKLWGKDSHDNHLWIFEWILDGNSTISTLGHITKEAKDQRVRVTRWNRFLRT